MKTLILAAVLLSAASGAAVAATSTPAVAASDSKNPNAPVPGKNSFTESQAKDRIQKAGYTAISALKLDDKGIWRGTATKGGKSMSVAVDYQGNVVGQ